MAPLKIRAGDKATYFLFFKDKNGDPLDLSDITEIKIAWLLSENDPENILLKTGAGTGTPITVIEPKTDGKVRVELTTADTDVTPACYAHAVQLTDNEGPLTAVFDEENKPIEILPKLFIP